MALSEAKSPPPEPNPRVAADPRGAAAVLVDPRVRWLANLNLLLVAVFWGLNMPVMKFALGRMDEYLFNALRLMLSAIVLGVCAQWSLRRNGTWRKGPARGRRLWLLVILFALLTGFAYQILFLLGINATSAGNTALIMTAIPIWTAVLAFFILRERLAGRAWLGMLVAVAGVLIVTLGKGAAEGDEPAAGTLAGNVLVSVAAFSWALGSVVSRPLMMHVAPISLAFYSVALSVPLHFLVARHALGELTTLFSDPLLLVALIYSGVFSTGLAYAMWNFGVKHLGAARAAGFQNLVPLVALLASWLLIAETPYLVQLLGGLLIIGGLVAMRQRRVAA